MPGPKKPTRLRAFTLTDPVFWAGKAGASCALALLLVNALTIPDMVTASFVAVLCCSPAAVMGVRISIEQFAGSAIGGFFGTLGLYLGLPQVVGVPIAVSLAILCTQGFGFFRGTVAAFFTALFVQIVSFGDPLETFGYRMAAVCIAAASAFAINVAVSSFFYRSLFHKRLRKMQARIETLSEVASQSTIAPMHTLFASLSELESELSLAGKELAWRGDRNTESALATMRTQLLWMRDYVHLVVDLEFFAEPDDTELRAFLSWLVTEAGDAPQFRAAQSTRHRILKHLEARPFLVVNTKSQ